MTYTCSLTAAFLIEAIRSEPELETIEWSGPARFD